MRSRQKILDATLSLIEEGGFEAVNVAAVAVAAGVSRQTVYSNFGTREEVVSQTMAALAVEVLGAIDMQLKNADTLFDYIAELMVALRTALREHSVLATLVRGDHGNPLFDDGMMARAKPVALQMMSSLVERGLATEDELDDILEISIRFGLSVIMFDSESIATDDGLRDFLRRWLLPAIS